MPVDLVIPVPDVDVFIGTATNKFDYVNLYSSSSRGGTYALLTSIQLVAGDTTYSYTHVAGTSTTWYKTTYYNSITLNESPISEAEPFPAKRGITTRKELRQMIIKNFGGEVHTPSSYTTLTAVSSTLIDSGRDADWFTGWHLFRPDAASAADNDRRVTAYTNTTGTLTHGGNAYSDVAVASEEIEIMPVDIDYSTLNSEIGRGLQKARFLYRYEFGATTSQRQYNLPHFVEGPEYVPDVWFRNGTTANNWEWHLFASFGRWWRVRGSAFKCILDINPAMAENDVIGVDVWRPGERLDSETDFTDVHEVWAEAAAMVSVTTYLLNRDLTRHGKSNYGALLQMWNDELRKAARTYGPTGGMKLQIQQPPVSWPEV